MAVLAGAVGLACGSYLPAVPSGPGYTYGRVRVPYRSERRGQGFDRAYARAFGHPSAVAEGRDPGPIVGGTPGGYRYNEHRGSEGEALAPAPETPPTPAPEATIEDAGGGDAGPSDVDGGPS